MAINHLLTGMILQVLPQTTMFFTPEKWGVNSSFWGAVSDPFSRAEVAWL